MVGFIDLNEQDGFLSKDSNDNYEVCVGKELAPSTYIGTCMKTKMEHVKGEYGGEYGNLVFQNSESDGSRVILNLDYGTITQEDSTTQGSQYQIEPSKGRHTDQVEGEKLTIRTQGNQGNIVFVITKTDSKAGGDYTRIY